MISKEITLNPRPDRLSNAPLWLPSKSAFFDDVNERNANLELRKARFFTTFTTKTQVLSFNSNVFEDSY